MRRTRFMSLFLLLLSVAFFCVQDFRWALEAPLLAFRFMREGPSRLDRALMPSQSDLDTWQKAAEQNRDAKELAFVALHSHADREGVFRAAEQAVSLDPSLTWIYPQVAGRFHDEDDKPAFMARIKPWFAKVEAADPDNAVPFIWEAQMIAAQGHWADTKAALPKQVEAAAAQTDWVQAMDKAFAKPRFDDYSVNRFLLDREVFARHGWAKPSTMLMSTAAYDIQNLFLIRLYANVRTSLQAPKAGKDADKIYQQTVAFGQRMRIEGSFLITQLIGRAVELIGSKGWADALRKAGRVEEAALLDTHRTEFERTFREPFTHNAMYDWYGLVVNLMAGLVVLFGLLTLISVLYVNAKRWIRPQVRGRLYNVVTVAENYLPGVLFLCCLGLYVAYTPYAANFHSYMTTKDAIHQLEPFFYNTFAGSAAPGYLFLQVPRPFVNYIYWGLGALLVGALLAGYEEWRYRKSRPAKPAEQA
jgi:hypothetical protein